VVYCKHLYNWMIYWPSWFNKEFNILAFLATINWIWQSMECSNSLFGYGSWQLIWRFQVLSSWRSGSLAFMSDIHVLIIIIKRPFWHCDIFIPYPLLPKCSLHVIFCHYISVFIISIYINTYWYMSEVLRLRILNHIQLELEELVLC
jgi:hypothetical protein